MNKKISNRKSARLKNFFSNPFSPPSKTKGKKPKLSAPAKKQTASSLFIKFREGFSQWFVNFSVRMSAHEKELFVRRLSFLLKAGIPILQSLTMIKDQTASGRQKKIIAALTQDVSSGQSINASLSRFKNVFGSFIINVVRVGENTGFLYQNLNYLSDELKKRRLLKTKVVGSLIYPIFIAIATVGMTTLLIIFIFPKIMPILKSVNAQLPVTTRFLISLSNFLIHDGLYVLLGLIVFTIAATLISKLSKVRFFMDNLVPSIPLIGPIFQNYFLANICRTLGLLLKSNVTLIEALKITTETTPNLVYKKMLEKITESILRGEKFSNQFSGYQRFFPVLVSQMIAVGEATGSLSGTILYLAEFYESEVDEMTKNLSNTIEPLLMILMGVIVGFVVISIITPIYGITQHLNLR
jgi:type IV pilus assembly protein PilC